MSVAHVICTTFCVKNLKQYPSVLCEL